MPVFPEASPVGPALKASHPAPPVLPVARRRRGVRAGIYNVRGLINIIRGDIIHNSFGSTTTRQTASIITRVYYEQC